MKALHIAAAAFVIAGSGLLAAAAPASAQDVNIAIPGFNFSFDTGNVAYAYHDGYWDHAHHWHAWRNDREAREFRAHYADRYDDRRHDRVDNGGWREEHHDEHHEERHN